MQISLQIVVVVVIDVVSAGHNKMAASKTKFLFISLMWVLTFLRKARMSHAVENPNLVLFVVFDGFGWDFMQKASTPNLDGLIQTGATVPFVWNVFPTSSLPIH